MSKAEQVSVAENLCRLAKEFKSGDPQQAADIKRDFKNQSKNDVVRATVYLMEVIGARDAAFKQIEAENKDLKELLNLKAPGWDSDGDQKETESETTKLEKDSSANSISTTGSEKDGTTQADAN